VWKHAKHVQKLSALQEQRLLGRVANRRCLQKSVRVVAANLEGRAEKNLEEKAARSLEEKAEKNPETKAEINLEEKAEINLEEKAEINLEEKAEISPRIQVPQAGRKA